MSPPGSSTSLPRVHTREFDGPLDLLLEEVRLQNVEIEIIAMAPIVSRFLDYMAAAAEHNLALDMEWLHMAATLIHWKSQSLLQPEPGGRAEPDPIREGLVRQLLAHCQHLGEDLGRRSSVEQNRISRPVTGAVEADSGGEAPRSLSVWDMIQQARELARWVELQREHRRQWQALEITPDDVTVSDMVEYLRTQLPTGDGDEVDAVRLMRAQPAGSRRSGLFLGLLEMVRNQELHVSQDEEFGPIWIKTRATWP